MTTIFAVMKVLRFQSEYGFGQGGYSHSHRLRVYRSKHDSKQIRQIGRIYLNWLTFNFTQKSRLWHKYMCNDLNFFIFKKDNEFFKLVVKEIIQSKLEKTFIDLYMLAMSTGGESAGQYCDQILKYASSISLSQTLNSFELCLLIDVCIKKGTNKHKIHAKAIFHNISCQFK